MHLSELPPVFTELNPLLMSFARAPQEPCALGTSTSAKSIMKWRRSGDERRGKIDSGARSNCRRGKNVILSAPQTFREFLLTLLDGSDNHGRHCHHSFFSVRCFMAGAHLLGVPASTSTVPRRFLGRVSVLHFILRRAVIDTIFYHLQTCWPCVEALLSTRHSLLR